MALRNEVPIGSGKEMFGIKRENSSISELEEVKEIGGEEGHCEKFIIFLYKNYSFILFLK